MNIEMNQIICLHVVFFIVNNNNNLCFNQKKWDSSPVIIRYKHILRIITKNLHLTK